MALTAIQLKAEVGERAWGLLETDEQTAILTGCGSNLALAGMRTFELLWKRFKPTYRMGKIYQADSDRYEEYYKMYCKYANSTGAGVLKDAVRTKPSVDQWRDLL